MQSSVQSLDFILGVQVLVTGELGRARLLARDILQLCQGSVIELHTFAGEVSFDVLANGTVIGRGEVVVANEKIGIRLSEVVSPTERVESLGNVLIGKL